jgi:hypothetical protein
MHKKEHKERTSNGRVNDSGNGVPAKFTTISVIGYEFTSEKRPFER